MLFIDIIKLVEHLKQIRELHQYFLILIQLKFFAPLFYKKVESFFARVFLEKSRFFAKLFYKKAWKRGISPPADGAWGSTSDSLDRRGVPLSAESGWGFTSDSPERRGVSTSADVDSGRCPENPQPFWKKVDQKLSHRFVRTWHSPPIFPQKHIRLLKTGVLLKENQTFSQK